MNKRKFLLHLGPPKTASTSLQTWLESQFKDSEMVHYLGAKQPRKFRDNKDSYKCLSFIKGNKSLERLKEVLDKNKSEIIVYSEEMILINDVNSRLLNILKLLKDYDVYLAYCYRDSEEVIKSFYAEIYPSLKEKFKNDFDTFLKSEYLKGYDLDFLITFCKKNNINLNIFSYRNLISGKINLNDLFDTSIKLSTFNESILLEKINAKKNKLNKGDFSYQVVDKTRIPLFYEKKIIVISNLINKDILKFFHKKYYIKIPTTKTLLGISKKNKEVLKKFNNYDLQ